MIAFITLMILKEFPTQVDSAEYIEAFAEYLEGAGYTPRQLNDDHGLFWKLDNMYRAYSHPAPFGV